MHHRRQNRVRFRLNVTAFDETAWRDTIGCNAPADFLSCRMDEAQDVLRDALELNPWIPERGLLRPEPGKEL